jgi:hypothetical protein
MAAPGCSSFSKQARREAAYRKYVRKARHNHDKQLAKATKAANRPLRQPPHLSEPKETISTFDSNGSETVVTPTVMNRDSGQPTP